MHGHHTHETKTIECPLDRQNVANQQGASYLRKGHVEVDAIVCRMACRRKEEPLCWGELAPILAHVDVAMLVELRERLEARGGADAVVELVADLREPELWRTAG